MVVVEVANVLIVDHDDAFVARFVRDFSSKTHVQHERSVAAGLAALGQDPDLVLIEACMPDGCASELVAAARTQRKPPVVIAVSDRASRAQVAELMWEGADAYLDKPLQVANVMQVLDGIGDGVEQCQRLARKLVGRIGLKQAQVALRGMMNAEALARTGGSRRAAASLLGVDRRYVQRMIDELGGAEPAAGSVG